MPEGQASAGGGKRLAPWEAEALEKERRIDAAMDELREYERQRDLERAK
jgi:hypothetical protein